MSATDVMLITGASSGFGRLMAETFARKRYTVYASMRHTTGHNAAASAALRTLAETEGLSLHVIDLDVTDEASVERAVQAVIERTGRIDILVNNAGLIYVGLNEAYTLEDVQRLFDTNVFGVIRMNRAVLPHMRHQGSGLILYLSSIGGRFVFPFAGLYCASKFALEALAESYAYQLYGLGIDSVIIEPGRYATALSSKTLQPSDPARAAGYGAVAAQLEQAGTGFLASFSSPDCPDPQEVVDAVVQVVTMPSGARPLRLPLVRGRGSLEALEALNHMTTQMQTDILERVGLAGLMTRPLRRSHDA